MASEAEQNIPDVDDVVNQLRQAHKQLVESSATVWDSARDVIEASDDPQVVEDGIPLAKIDQDREKVLDVTTRGISRSDELISILDTLFEEVDVIDHAAEMSPVEKKRRKMAIVATAAKNLQSISEQK